MDIAICDDQQEYNDKLDFLLKNYFNYNQIINFNITSFTSGIDLSNMYSYGMFDFIFLDVQMPCLNGEKTAELIRSQDLEVNIVFVTNMKDQPYMGYNYNAKGFLIKEVQQEDIDQLMDRLLGEMSRRKDVGVYPIKQKPNNDTLYLKLANIIYFESSDKNITAITKDVNFVFRAQLNDVEKELSAKGFLRIHNSFLVNISHVFKDFGDGLIMLGRPEKLPISKSRKQTVRQALSSRK